MTGGASCNAKVRRVIRVNHVMGFTLLGLAFGMAGFVAKNLIQWFLER